LTALERFLDSLKGRLISGTPCVPLIFGYAAALCKVKLSDYLQKGELLAYCQLEAQKQFGTDAVFAYADNSVESEALGSRICFPENDYPYITDYAWGDHENWTSRPLPDAQKDGRMPQLLEAVKIMRSTVGDTTTVVGGVLGPMSIAGQVMGLDKLIYLLVDEPDKFARAIDYTAHISLSYGQALLNAGAHVLMLLEPTASQNIIPQNVFVQYITPRIRYIFSGCKSAGALACWLVITGQTKGLLPYYKGCGADLATIDYEVPLKNALNAAPDLSLAGNIKPYNFVEHSQEELYDQAKKLISEAGHNRRFLLSSGCELPLNAKPENVEAMVRAARGGLNGANR